MFRHIIDPKTGSQQRALLEPLVNVRDIKTPDDHTLVVPLKTPHASFPSLLMNYNAYVIPDGSASTIGKTGIGTGPFKLESFTPARNGRVVANADYWDGPPNLDAIEFKTIQDTQARVNALLAGDVDFLSQTSLDFAQADVVKANKNTTVEELKNYFMYTIPMLVTQKPFDDLRVRQAFKLAYDPRRCSSSLRRITAPWPPTIRSCSTTRTVSRSTSSLIRRRPSRCSRPQASALGSMSRSSPRHSMRCSRPTPWRSRMR